MDLNIFNLRGPEFLVFFTTVSVITIIIVWYMRRWIEGGEVGEEESLAKNIAKDPYQIAYLHGGRLEVIRVAVVSLLERGLMNADGDKLQTQDSNAAVKVRRPLDKAIVTKFAEAQRGQDVCTDSVIQMEADVIGAPLKEMKLIPDAGTYMTRLFILLVAIGFLEFIAGMKIYIALQRGHTNIIFLIILAVIAPIILCIVLLRFRTVLGDKCYAYLHNFFNSLNNRRNSFDLQRTTSELTFLAAVFGISALPSSFGGMIKSLKIHPPGQSGVLSGGCGSACGAGGGGGGGCGGGGCGGGCGGCG